MSALGESAAVRFHGAPAPGDQPLHPDFAAPAPPELAATLYEELAAATGAIEILAEEAITSTSRWCSTCPSLCAERRARRAIVYRCEVRP